MKIWLMILLLLLCLLAGCVSTPLTFDAYTNCIEGSYEPTSNMKVSGDIESVDIEKDGDVCIITQYYEEAIWDDYNWEYYYKMECKATQQQLESYRAEHSSDDFNPSMLVSVGRCERK